jgi:hypothetical protein
VLVLQVESKAIVGTGHSRRVLLAKSTAALYN